MIKQKSHIYLAPLTEVLSGKLNIYKEWHECGWSYLVQRDSLIKHKDLFWPLIFSNTGSLIDICFSLSYEIILIFFSLALNPFFTFSVTRLVIKIQNTLWQGIHEIEGCIMIDLYLKVLLFLSSVMKWRSTLRCIWLSRQVRWSQKCRLQCPVAFLNHMQYTSHYTTLKELLEQRKWSETRWRQ